MATITYDQFEAFAKNFVTLSSKVGDSWELRTTTSIPAAVYLVKTCTQLIETEGLSYDSSDQHLEEDIIQERDDVSVRQDVLQTHYPVRLEYHVVYSVSYEVPTLYVNAYHQCGKPLSVTDIWKLIPPYYGSASNTKWGILSQQDHPVLNRPFYYIHPCHTSKALSAVYSQAQDVPVAGASPCDSSSNYILTWLSMFGPLVGLNLSLQYCNTINIL